MDDSGQDGMPDPAAISAPSDQCWIALEETTNQLWVGLQTNDANSVVYAKISPKDQKIFDAARKKEVQGLLDLGAYRILSLEESLKFRERHPEYVLPSRFVDRWKAQDDGINIAKSRLVILGFKDPHVLQLERLSLIHI